MMIRLMCALVVLGVWGFPASVCEAQNAGEKKPVEIFLEDSNPEVEPDMPSVDLILNFEEIRYQSLATKKSFLKETVRSVERAPF